jgi:hypothetical protein
MQKRNGFSLISLRQDLNINFTQAKTKHMAKETNQMAIPDEIISSKIYLIRDKKVILDRDLAGLYDIKAIRLREQVKRNMERLPENFMFQLSEKEVDILVSQNAIPSRKHLGGYLPYAFTEHGILMLANVIKSERAIKMSIRNRNICPYA